MKRRHLIAIMLAVLLVLLSSPVTMQTVSLSVQDASGGPESTVGVPINLSGGSNIGSMTIVITYDSSILQVNGVKKGDLTKNSLLESNEATSGIVAIGIADVGGIDGDGAVATVEFEVVGDLGDTCSLTLERVEANDADTHIDIPVTRISGIFTAKEVGFPVVWVVVGIVLGIAVIGAIVYGLRRRRQKEAYQSQS